MKNLFDQLQLKPHERRLVVLGALVLFVVLNLWFIWPHYGDLAQIRAQISRNQTDLQTYQAECVRTNHYLTLLQDLERNGAGVLDEDKDIKLLSTIQTQIRNCGVNEASVTPAPRSSQGGTNEFFEQRALSITLQPNAPEPLIQFLISLATNEVVLRVKDLDLKPDGTKTKLSGSLRVVASFQRKALAPAAPEPAPPPVKRTPST